MKRKITLALVFAILIVTTKAQEEKESNPFSLTASYYSINISQPGFKLGYEKPFMHFDKTKTTKKEVSKTKHRNIYYCFNVGYYDLPKISNNLFIDAGLGYRRFGHKGLITGVELGLMGINAFNAGKTYEVSSSGDIDEVTLASNQYFAPRLNLELGYKINNFWALSIKPGAFFQMPHFKSSIMQISFEATIKYQF